jgi:hypothetical protein
MLTINLEREQRANMPNRYKRIGPEELSAGLDCLGLTAGKFARLVGTQRKRVLQWLEPSDAKGEDIPHNVNALLHLMLSDPENMNRLLVLADEYIEEEDAE